mgnify:CR=1 FL=1
MNSDMSQQVYQMLGDRYQPAIEYAMLRNYAQQLGNLQQDPYFYAMLNAYNNQPNFAMLQGGNNTPQKQQYLDNIKLMFQQPMAKINSLEIGNRLLTGDIRPTSSAAGSSL